MDTYKIVYAFKREGQPIEVLSKLVLADTPQKAISEFNKSMQQEQCYTIITVCLLLGILPAKEKTVDNSNDLESLLNDLSNLWNSIARDVARFRDTVEVVRHIIRR